MHATDGKSGSWSLYQRGDSGEWTLRFKDPETQKWRDKRIPRDATVHTKHEAEKWARDWLRAQLEARTRGKQAGQTVSDYLDGWLERRRLNPKVRASTRDNNRGHIRIHIAPALGAVLLPDLRAKEIRDFVVGLRTKSVAPRGKRSRAPRRALAAHTIRNIVATLRDALDDAVGEELIPSNPGRTALVSAEIPQAETRAGENVIVHIPVADAERVLTCQHVPEERRTRYCWPSPAECVTARSRASRGRMSIFLGPIQRYV